MTREGEQRRGSYLLCYALFAIVVALSFVVFAVWRAALDELIGAAMGRSYANRLLYQVGILGIGLALFILVMAAEPYLRNGVERRKLIPRFVRLAVPLTVVSALGILLQLLISL